MTRFHRFEWSWLAYGAALWSLVFAVFHIVWALGWYVGLDEEMARKAFQTTWKLVYDIVVAGICVLGVFLPLAFVQPWGRRLPRWGINFVGWCATGLLLLRSGGSIVQTIYFVLTGKLSDILRPMALWELWFYLGTTLFCLSFWRFRRDSRLPANCGQIRVEETAVGDLVSQSADGTETKVDCPRRQLPRLKMDSVSEHDRPAERQPRF